MTTCNQNIMYIVTFALGSMLFKQFTWLRKVSWDPLQWTLHNPYAVQGSKTIHVFQFTTTLGRHILTAQTAQEPATAKIWHTYHVPYTIITIFQWQLIHKSLRVGAW